MERGRARGKRAFASSKVLGLETEICCAENSSGEEAASNKFSAQDFLERRRARGKWTFTSGRGLLSSMPWFLDCSIDGSVDDCFFVGRTFRISIVCQGVSSFL